MSREFEEFSAEDLERRKHFQDELQSVLLSLKDALHRQRYEEAIFCNLECTRMLRMMVEAGLAIHEEKAMVNTLKHNTINLLRLQSRFQ